MDSACAKNERYAVAATPILRLIGDFAVEPADLSPTGRKARALLARLALADAPLARVSATIARFTALRTARPW